MKDFLRTPAEWEPQKFVQLTLPTPESDWKDNFREIINCYREMIEAITSFQTVLLICQDVAKAKTQLSLDHAVDIIWVEENTNDTWCRDYGGITVFKNQQKGILDFTFNGWGNKFEATLDNQITGKLKAAGHYSDCWYEKVDFVLEGGSIDTNGRGVFLTTSQCLLNANRNPNFSKIEISRLLREKLGAKKILWLTSGTLIGDDTDGHIDTLARFLNEDSIVYTQCKDAKNPHYPTLKAMEEELQSFTDLKGKPFNLYPLPLPDPVFSPTRQQLPATYINFLFINDALLVPTFRQEKDREVINFFRSFISEKEIIGIDCIPLIQQGGGIHCAGMEF